METVERKSSRISLYVRKIIVIIVGAVISAYGITLAIGAGYGSATLAVLWQGVAKTAGITLGLSSVIIAAGMIVAVFFYDRRQIHIGTLLYQVIYSFFVDVFGKIQIYPNNKYVCFVIMVTGICVFAIGTGMYASAKLGRGSYEAVTFSIAEKNHFPIRIVRIILDATVVLIGFLLGGSVGICTVVTILISGPIIQLSNKLSTKVLHMDVTKN